MKISLLYLLFFFVLANVHAQLNEPITSITEQQLENSIENNEEIIIEDDSYLQQLLLYIQNPINLNTADFFELSQLRMLTSIQIHHFILYRTLIGKLIDVYELQSIPGWDKSTIEKIRPYINVSLQVTVLNTFKSRLSKGDHLILLRTSQVFELSTGYVSDSSTTTNFYSGSPQKLFFRYTYLYKNIFQYGILAEKDAGEQFFKGKQKHGFDFYSAHIFSQKIGIIKSLALGDFTVNIGQGLTQWQSLEFKKSSDVIHIKREADVLRPYNSAGEINFHRGIGVTLEKNNWQFTFFGSYKNIDANRVVDTTQSQDEFVSALQTSGYHRTKSELADKQVQSQFAYGGNFSYKNKKLHLSISGIKYKFKFPLIKSDIPYHAYTFFGKRFSNYSIDYSYTYKNLHYFGELAFTGTLDKAFINGIMLSSSSHVDLSFLYRNISKLYNSFYATAFTESTLPNNENGFYAGISIKHSDAWRIEAYADFFKFPWLRYRVDAPSTGTDYLVQLNYKPNKQLEIYTRYRAKSKAINANFDLLTLSTIVQQPKINWRIHINYKVNCAVTLRTRTEMTWFDKKGISAEQGFLLYFDCLFKPMLKPYSVSLRLQYFETEGYNSRLYAYENDILYNFSIPIFYGKGHIYYININYDVDKKLSIWVKYAQTIYNDKTVIGSGLDEIKGNVKTELKVQAIYKF